MGPGKWVNRCRRGKEEERWKRESECVCGGPTPNFRTDISLICRAFTWDVEEFFSPIFNSDNSDMHWHTLLILGDYNYTSNILTQTPKILHDIFCIHWNNTYAPYSWKRDCLFRCLINRKLSIKLKASTMEKLAYFSLLPSNIAEALTISRSIVFDPKDYWFIGSLVHWQIMCTHSSNFYHVNISDWVLATTLCKTNFPT